MKGLKCVVANNIAYNSQNNSINCFHAKWMHIEFSLQKDNADGIINRIGDQGGITCTDDSIMLH